MRAVVRDPLFIFAVAGAAIFYVKGAPTQTQTEKVDVDAGGARLMIAAFEGRNGRLPTPAELDELFKQHFHDEVLFREAKRLGLGEGDTIVRRRLIAKMHFLLSDRRPVADPTEEQLSSFLRENSTRYQRPPRSSFAHVFFRDSRSDSEGDARRAMALLEGSEDPSGARGRGDSSMLAFTQTGQKPARVAQSFSPEFADHIAALELGRWHGPIRSRHGVHLVWVMKRTPARTYALDEVRHRASADYVATARKSARKAETAALLSRYELQTRVDRGELLASVPSGAAP